MGNGTPLCRARAVVHPLRSARLYPDFDPTLCVCAIMLLYCALCCVLAYHVSGGVSLARSTTDKRTVRLVSVGVYMCAGLTGASGSARLGEGNSTV